MIRQLIFIGIIWTSSSLNVGEAACSTFGTELLCDGSDYCYWTTTCVDRPCYIVNDIAACRQGAPLATGALSSKCDSLETFSLQYDNVCCNEGEGRLNYALVRYVISSEGSATQSTDSTPVALGTIVGTADDTNMFRLYTVNLMKSTTLAQVHAILDAYKVTFASLLSTSSTSHPFYMERIIQQTLQYLRDYEYMKISSMTDTLSWGTKSPILVKVWAIADLLHIRLRAFSPNYYQTNYYFVNFASIPLSRLQLVVNGQLNTVTITWSSYSTNGYMQVVSFAPEQFGLNYALSDVLMVRPYGVSGSIDGSQTYTLTWTWSDPNLSVVVADVKIYSFNPTTGVTAYISAATCTAANKSCVSGTITGQQDYFFAYTPGLCNSKNEVQCKLAYCTWTSGTSQCS